MQNATMHTKTTVSALFVRSIIYRAVLLRKEGAALPSLYLVSAPLLASAQFPFCFILTIGTLQASGSVV